MIQANELILLLFGLGAFVFILLNNARLKQLPVLSLFVHGFYCLLAGWFFTVVEGFVWPRAFNVLEHIAYFTSAVLLLLWCIQLVRKRGKR